MDFLEARQYVEDLLVDCPFEPNPPHCALHDMRKKPWEERIEWSRRLTKAQMESIIGIHKLCFGEKKSKFETV